MSYGSMQLFESIIWLGIDLNNPNLNKIGSVFGCLLLYLHPLAIMLGMKSDNLYQEYQDNIFFHILFIISILFAIYGIYQISSNKKKFLSFPETINKHLVWDFPDDYHIVTLISLLISIIIFKENKIFWVCIIIYYFSPALIISQTNEVSNKNKNKNYNGSYWCWYVAIFSFILYFLNPKIQTNKYMKY